MNLKDFPDIHLSYCSNIHPGESLDEVFLQLNNHLPELKRRLSPNNPFGIGLRLSAGAAEELSKGRRIDEFKNWLHQEDLYVFTINGFPYGSFHGTSVKSRVYEPDWSTQERSLYTLKLADILSRLLPEESEGSISTSPLGYKYHSGSDITQHQDDTRIQRLLKISVKNLADVAYQLSNIRKSTGVYIHVDIEPEPDCILENSNEAIDFFLNKLIPHGSRHISHNHQLSESDAESIIRDHIQICYDTCHFAIEYEKPEEALAKFKHAGIGIGKLQISSALKVPLSNTIQERDDIAGRLQSFVEPTYLHQVIERTQDGSIRQYRDLPEALPHILNPDAREWRIHFHIPVFSDTFSGLQSTRDDIVNSLNILKTQNYTRHLEIETYTWDVIPVEMKTNLLDSIEREIRWTLGNFER